MKKPTEAELDALFEKIAQEDLNIETLKRRNRDSLDFHENAVWNIRRALNRAFNEGVKAALANLPPGVKKDRG